MIGNSHMALSIARGQWNLSILAEWKSDSYDSVLVMVDQFTKIVYYKPVKVAMAPGLAIVIIDVVIYYHGVPKSIVMD